MKAHVTKGIIWISGVTFEQSKWLGEQGFWFYGAKSNAGTAAKMKERAIPLNTRYIPAEQASVIAKLAGNPAIEWSPEVAAILAPAAETSAASWATDAEITIPAPAGLEYRGYQRAGVDFALRAFNTGRKAIIIGDEMGLGKTMQAIGVMALTNPKLTLVACPASLRLNWQREITKWLPALAGSVHIVNGGEVVPSHARVVIVNYDKVVGKGANATKIRDGLDIDWDLAVFDEAHYLKNPDAQRSKYFLGAFKRGVRKETGIIDRAKRMLILTGTPIQNRVRESLGLFRAAGAFSGAPFKDELQFLFRHCGATRGTHGWAFDGATNLEELGAKLRSGGVMVRRLKAEVAKELPPKVRSVIALPYDGRLRTSAPADLSGDFAEAVARLTTETVGFREISAMRAELAEAKADMVIDHVRTTLETQNKVIVFAHHQSLINAIHGAFDDGSALKSPLIRIDGGTPPEARQALVDRFQSDSDCHVALLSTHAAGVGLTLTAASHVVFAEADWNPAWAVQAEDRAHRIGQTADVTVEYLVLDGTLDAHVIATMVDKMNIADKALDAGINVAPAPAAPPARPAAPAGERAVAICSRSGASETIVVTDDRKQAVAEALRFLSGRCDGAHLRDDVGFNGRDAQSEFVQTLVGAAVANALTDKQAAWGVKILRTYSKTQLSHIWHRIG
jgi:SWI/SNF-related matrix-associated actin-dependent regulator 1 of chromatin subfamily A